MCGSRAKIAQGSTKYCCLVHGTVATQSLLVSLLQILIIKLSSIVICQGSIFFIITFIYRVPVGIWKIAATTTTSTG